MFCADDNMTEVVSKLNEPVNSRIIIFAENHTAPEARELHHVLLNQFAKEHRLVYLNEGLNDACRPDNIAYHLPLENQSIKLLDMLVGGLVQADIQADYDTAEAFIEKRIDTHRAIIPKTVVYVLKLRLYGFPQIIPTLYEDIRLRKVCFSNISDTEALLVIKETERKMNDLLEASKVLSVTKDLLLTEKNKVLVFTNIVKELHRLTNTLTALYVATIRYLLRCNVFPPEETIFTQKLMRYLDGDESVGHPIYIMRAWRNIYMANKIIQVQRDYTPLNVFVKVGRLHLTDDTQHDIIGILTLLKRNESSIQVTSFNLGTLRSFYVL